MIAVIDYGVGNLFSLCASLDRLSLAAEVTSDPEKIRAADRIILPGVGAFGDAADRLHECGLFEFLQEQAREGKPFLGICLGMQLLFEKSSEYGIHEGLGLIPGEVVSMADDLPQGSNLKIPQMGWNSLHIHDLKDPVLCGAGIKEGNFVYFVHSYYARNCSSYIVASVDYGVQVPAVVRNNHVWGMQFHPEKSGPVGLSLLRAFAEIPLEAEAEK